MGQCRWGGEQVKGERRALEASHEIIPNTDYLGGVRSAFHLHVNSTQAQGGRVEGKGKR